MILSDQPPSWMAVTFSPDGVIRSVAPGDVRLSTGPAAGLVGCHITHLLAVAAVLEIPLMIRTVRESGFWEGPVSLRSGECSVSASGRLAAISDMDSKEETFLLLMMLREHRPGSVPGQDTLEVGAKLRELAHQMNNPLAVMMGYAQLALMDMPAGGRLRADVELIFEQTQRMAGLVEKLRDYGAALQAGVRMQPGAK
jgi:nitrogen-specific signal transduction histidine kinase